MKIIFAGTPLFALPALRKLLSSHHQICAVYTQPDRPAGRGQKLTPSPTKTLAQAYNLPLYQPPTLKDQSAQQELRDLDADILVNVAYGMLLPEAVLNIPKLGCINIHPSLLPRWRGAAPIQRAIMAGDAITGVTIMKMDIGLDTGDIYKQISLPIDNTDTTQTLAQKTAEIGANLLIEVLAEIENGTAKTTTQDNSQTTYANKISKEEGKVDWHKSAIEIERMIRAFNPWPIAYMQIDEEHIRIWQAKVETAEPTATFIAMQSGTIIKADKDGIRVKTGDDKLLCLLKIQLPGGKPLMVSDIINAKQQKFAPGQKLF